MKGSSLNSQNRWGDPSALLRAVEHVLPACSSADGASWSCASASLELVREVAQIIARFASNYSDHTFVIALLGPLGSGKTTFVKSLAGELGVPESDVLSPTFTYVSAYQEGLMPLYHFDLYRLVSSFDFEELGFGEYLSLPGICCLEWAEKIWANQDRLPPRHLQVQLQFVPKRQHKRCMTLKAMPLVL